MALNTKNLTAPGDVNAVDGAKIAGSVGGSGGHMPTWGVGDPVATALAGFQKGMERFKEHYDKSKADEFLINKKMELDKLYFDKDNGLFNTRKGEAAQGLYQEGVEYMSNMWNKDAQDNLSDKQRILVSKGMNQLFNDYSHKIAKYETDEMINGTKQRIQNNIYNCKNMVANGNFTEEDLGMAIYGIRSGEMDLGNLQGLDAETIGVNQKNAVGDMLGAAFTSLAATDPMQALGMAKTYLEYIPEAQREALLDTLDAKAKTQNKNHYMELVAAGKKEEADAFLRSLSPQERPYPAYGGGKPFNKGGTIAEDYNNPLNEKKPNSKEWVGNNRADTRQYETMGDGIRGNVALLGRYKNKSTPNRDANGNKISGTHKVSTLQDYIYTWAPPEDRNDSKSYLAAVAKAVGLSPEEAKTVDITGRVGTDKDFTAKMFKAMAIRESPVGNRISVDDIKNALDGKDNAAWANSKNAPEKTQTANAQGSVSSDKVPTEINHVGGYQKHTGGFTNAEYQELKDKGDKFVETKMIDETVENIVLQLDSDNVTYKTKEERIARAEELSKQFPEKKLRDKVFTAVKQRLEQKFAVEEASYQRVKTAFMDELLKSNPNATIYETRQAMQAAQLPEPVQKSINADLEQRRKGTDNKGASMIAARKIRAQIDAAGDMPEEEKLRLCWEYGLTGEDEKAVMGYHGRGTAFNQTDFDAWVKKAIGNGISESQKAQLYQIFMQGVKEGETTKAFGGRWDDDTICHRLRTLWQTTVDVKGAGLFGSDKKKKIFEAQHNNDNYVAMPETIEERNAVMRRIQSGDGAALFTMQEDGKPIVPQEDRDLMISWEYQRMLGIEPRIDADTKKRFDEYAKKAEDASARKFLQGMNVYRRG